MVRTYHATVAAGGRAMSEPTVGSVDGTNLPNPLLGTPTPSPASSGPALDFGLPTSPSNDGGTIGFVTSTADNYLFNPRNPGNTKSTDYRTRDGQDYPS